MTDTFRPEHPADLMRVGRKRIADPDQNVPSGAAGPSLVTCMTIGPLVERVEAAAHGSAGATRLT